MKKYLSAFFVSLILFSAYQVYAASTGDLNIQVWNGSSYDSVDLTPPFSDADSFLKWDYNTNQYRLERAAGYLHVDEINGLSAVISGINNAISDKANASHQHNIVDVTGLQTALDSKADIGHTHAIADVTGLQTALNGKGSATALGQATSSILSIQNYLRTVSTSSPVTTNGVSRTIETSSSATGTLLSASSTSNVVYSVNIVTTATIGGASSGEVFLEISPTNTSTSTWTVVSKVKNSQTITLALVLNSVQDITYNLTGNVPAGYYVRLRSNNISGTPTYSFVTGQEMQF